MNARPLWIPRSELTPEEVAALKAGLVLMWAGPQHAAVTVSFNDGVYIQRLPSLPETIARLDTAIANVRRYL